MEKEEEKQVRAEQQTQDMIRIQRIDRVEEPFAGEGDDKKATGWSRFAWIVVAILSGIYIIIPEPTDVIPILGWLDEVTAFLIMTTALSKLGIKIPFLDRIFQGRLGGGEKDVTPRG